MPNGAKRWVFTLNNYTNDDKQQLADTAAEESVAIVYLVYGEEIGESGTPHLQGFVVFEQRRSLAFCRSKISATAHFEIARGTPAQAADYCKKDGAFTEFGKLPSGPSRRSSLDDLSQAIRNGSSAQEIEEEFPGYFIRYRSNILNSIRDRQPKRTWEMDVRILWGRSGAGKTRLVFDTHGYDDVYVHTGSQWFDGYDGQQIVLFDDFTGSEFKLGYLLKLLDRYPMRVPVKGGFVQWVPKTVYFTSNKDPKHWYLHALLEHQNALFRRITTIQHFE